MFKSISENSLKEMEARKHGRQNLRRFGIKFLDDALIGIRPSDLILLGAPSGVGKTGLCCNIALANMVDGRRVHFMALEAEEFEIERRFKYELIAKTYFSPEYSQFRIPGLRISYEKWLLGDFIEPLMELELQAAKHFEEKYKNFFVFYKQDRFGLPDLIESVVANGSQTDLFIIDHVHYFDLDDDNENRAMKQIAKTVRSLALEQGKPIILVAHLRKRDRANEDLCAGIDEFHGSSDLTKIATKVITVSSGERTSDGSLETFMRIPKDRISGSPSRFTGRLLFDPKRNTYEEAYKLGRSSLTRKGGFEELHRDYLPDWYRP